MVPFVSSVANKEIALCFSEKTYLALYFPTMAFAQLERPVMPSDPQNNMGPSFFYGSSVSVDGDWIVVGAPNQYGASHHGRAYFLNDSGGSWTQRHLVEGEPLSGNRLGVSVSMSGDLAAIGASCASNIMGRVFVHARDGNSWDRQATLAAPGITHFGAAVALDGTTLVAGHQRAQAVRTLCRTQMFWQRGRSIGWRCRDPKR